MKILHWWSFNEEPSVGLLSWRNFLQRRSCSSLRLTGESLVLRQVPGDQKVCSKCMNLDAIPLPNNSDQIFKCISLLVRELSHMQDFRGLELLAWKIRVRTIYLQIVGIRDQFLILEQPSANLIFEASKSFNQFDSNAEWYWISQRSFTSANVSVTIIQIFTKSLEPFFW